MTDDLRLPEVFAATRYVLLDFDGPVCDVFAGHPARDVAENLRVQLAAQYAEPLPDDVQATDDPLFIVRRVADFAPHLSHHIDAALRHAELTAAATAEPTPGTSGFLAACQATERPVAIVSNNSKPAIEAYLHQHDLTAFVHSIHGREAGDPRRMKPDPYLLAHAISALRAEPAASVLVGDSTTDVEAARAADVRVIGYVNKTGKDQMLRDADALTTRMSELAYLAGQASVADPMSWTSPRH